MTLTKFCEPSPNYKAVKVDPSFAFRIFDTGSVQCCSEMTPEKCLTFIIAKEYLDRIFQEVHERTL